MRLFLLQRLASGHCDGDTEVVRDSIDFRNWYTGQANEQDMAYRALFVDNMGDTELRTAVERLREETNAAAAVIPVGSIEFANRILSVCYQRGPIRALNIPEPLRRPEWLLRRIEPEAELSAELFHAFGAQRLFVKPSKYAKEFDSDMVSARSMGHLEGRRVFVSEPLPCPIQAEWRVFVNRQRLVGIRPYDLDGGWVCPDRDAVLSMIAAYEGAPPAYTLDVAVLADGRTALIEAHNFVCCGLYGFGSSKMLPLMLSAAFLYELSKEG